MMMETIPPGTIMHAHYRIERALGSGGFGHVYLALDLRTNQPCAIKEYLVTGASGQAQLQHEARVLSRLHHPHLPSFIDAFSERGRYYVVLSYIEGRDLTEYLRIARQRDEAIPLRLILSWLLAVCDAVHFLHSQQPPVIHRDIKPDNIRITSDGTAYLVDLGNAKAVADGARTLFFARHQGTPGYAPPEQYPGGSGTDARSDVYALGGTLYFALTMQEPASVSTRNQAQQQGLPDLPSLQEQLNRMLSGERAARQFRFDAAQPQPARAPRMARHVAQLATLSPELLQRLNMIIQRAMALKPFERYQSVAEFGLELQQVLEALQSRQTAAAPPAEPARPRDPHKTQPDLPQLYQDLQATRISGQGHLCPRCSIPLPAHANVCPNCGTLLAGGTPVSSPTSRAEPEKGGPAQTPGPAPASREHAPRAVVPSAVKARPQPDAIPQRPSVSQTQAGERGSPLRIRPSMRQQPLSASRGQPAAPSISLRLAIMITAIALAVLLLLFLFLLAITTLHGAGSLKPPGLHPLATSLLSTFLPVHQLHH